jgi:hypothetical protein
MRYLLLIYEEPPASPPSQADWDATMGEYNGFTGWLRDTGQYLGGEALHPVSAATTVSVRDGRRLITDGPFAETKEHLGGYYLIEAADLDAAIEAAARMPGARTGQIEIRPIMELG